MNQGQPRLWVNYFVHFSILFLLTSCALSPGMRSPSTEQDVAETNMGEVSVVPVRRALERLEPMVRLPVKTETGVKVYHVGARDILQVTVWNHPQLMAMAQNGEGMGFQVQPDGTFFFPYAGKITAAGKTVDQIRVQLTQKLKTVVKTPQVSVAVSRYGSQRIYVLGAVENPRVVPLDGYTVSLMEAIALSGGMTEHASGRNAYLLRKGQRFEIPLSALLNNGDIQHNVILQDGDVLHVPDNRNEKVYVLGAVKQPKSVYLTGGRLSLSEALVEGGGLDALSADARNVYVIRNEAGKARIYHLDMQNADALLLGEQFEMQPRDVIYVAETAVTQWNRVLNLIMPNIQSLFYLDALVR